MTDRYLITGASGFMGANVTRALVKKGAHVSIITREKSAPWRLSDIYSKLSVYRTGLLDAGLERAVDAIKPTVIFHFAAYGVNPWETDIDQMIQTNIQGSLRLISAVKKHGFRLFVYTGTSSEYGVKDHKMKESDLLEPVNDYSVTKAGATLLLSKIAKREALPIITLRPFSPYGYFEHPKRLFSSVSVSAISGKPIHVSHPDHVRDFVFIDDVVSAYFKTTRKRCPPGEIINIGSGREHSIGDVVKRIVTATKSRSKILWGTVEDQSRQIEPVHWRADISKAKTLLDWSPLVSLEDGVKKSVAWFSSHVDNYETV